jgi:hypothetical protein
MSRPKIKKEEPIVIDYFEFKKAQKDPKVQRFMRMAQNYKKGLIERGHCPKCLVVNCEHMETDRHGRGS